MTAIAINIGGIHKMKRIGRVISGDDIQRIPVLYGHVVKPGA